MTSRRLSAILAADVVGYSRMMEQDEEGTLDWLRSLRNDIVEPCIAAHGGRLVKTTGDGFLVEFPSPVEAVRASLEIQKANGRDRARKSEGGSLLRIGINLGDVIADGHDIYGDGVNVAARLEGLAKPGGICISRSVRDQVRDRLPITLEDLDEVSVKNLERQVRVFAIETGDALGLKTPIRSLNASSQAPLVLPDKPSIAVLPFTNMSGDPEQEYFADGVVEEIVTALSRVPRLFVIARNSSFTYKGRTGVDVRQVGRELGVHYVLQGSVRKAGGRIRIAGQLVEAQSGTHIWADKYDGSIAEIFGLQDSVTASVVGAIAPRLVSAEVERARRKRPGSLDAYDIYLQALPHVHSMSEQGNAAALALLNRALAIDPLYAAAAGLAAWSYTLRVAQGWCRDVSRERAEGCVLGRRAIAYGVDDPDALSMGGYAVAHLGDDLRTGVLAIERAIELNPNSAQSLTNAGWVYAYLGEASRAISVLDRSIRLSPRDPTLFRTFSALSWACLIEERYEEAVEWGTRAIAGNPIFTPAHCSLASALGHLGRVDEARDIVRQLLALIPDSTISGLAKTTPMRHSGRLPLILDGLRRAGLPEQ